MKITLRQFGGFTGLSQISEFDTNSMPKEKAAELVSLVEQSELLSQGVLSYRPSNVPGYEIQVETDQGVYKVKFDEMSIPPKAVPLLAFLSEHASFKT